MPYPNEHSARLKNPDDYKPIRVRRTKGSGDAKVQGVTIPNTIDVIWFILKEDSKEVPMAQALRFPIKNWTEAEAKAWLKKNKIKHSFEKATGKKDDQEDTVELVEMENLVSNEPESESESQDDQSTETEILEDDADPKGHEILDVFFAPCIVEKREDGYYLNGMFAEADKKNDNERIYSHSILATAIKKAKKRMIGLDSHFGGTYQSVVLKYVDLWMEGKKAMCRAKIVETRAGQDLKVVADEKIDIGLSMAGIGEESYDDKKKASIVQEGYVLKRIDAVLDPAFARAKAIKEERESLNNEQKGGIKMTKEEIKEMQDLKDQISTLNTKIEKMEADDKADKEVIAQYKKDLDKKNLKLEAKQYVDEVLESDDYKEHKFKDVLKNHLIKCESKAEVEIALPRIVETLNNFQAVHTKSEPESHVIKIKEQGFFGAKGHPTSIMEAHKWCLDQFKDTGIWHGSSKMDNPRWIADRLLKNYILAKMNRFNWDMLDNGVPDKDIFIESRLNPLYHLTRKGIKEALGDTEAYTSDLASTTDYILPLYTLIMKDIMEIINQVCAVQPMDRPTGKAFFLKEYYGDGAGTWDDIADGSFDKTKGDTAEAGTPQLVKVGIASENITLPNPKKFYAPFTIELELDLKAYFGMNVDSVHVQLMRREIAREIAYSIINDMLTGTAFTQAGGGILADTDIEYSTTAPQGWSEWEWIKGGLTRAFMQAGAKIDSVPFEVDPDFAIYDKNYKYLFTEPQFVADEVKMPSSFGFVRQGTYQGQYNLFKTSSTDFVSQILLGHRGKSFADAGELFLPYILFYLGERIPTTDMKASRSAMFRGTWKKVTKKKFMKINIT